MAPRSSPAQVSVDRGCSPAQDSVDRGSADDGITISIWTAGISYRDEPVKGVEEEKKRIYE